MDFNTIQSLQEAYDQVSQLMELTGGKGHPGYKAGSRDLGPMQSGHPADSRKRQVKGGTMSQRHGFHLGDIDDDDDDEDEYESIVKSQSRDKRETVRKPLRDKVKAARKVMTKENYEPDNFDIILEYLVAEGYADTNKAALAIMANMSEEWRESIVEGVRPGEVEKPLDKAAFKKRRRSLAGREASADATKRGHVDKFTGKPYGTEEAASRRRDIHSPEKAPDREARRKFAEDPD